jgi:Uma2 family endonuclease
MSVVLRKPNRLSEREYFDFENASKLRHEFVGGVIFAMVGGSDRHNLICGNVFAAIRPNLAAPCQAFSAQMKLRVSLADSVDHYYPDVFVTCDASDRAPLCRERPCLIIEVLSDSTEMDDRRSKFLAYTTIPSLQEYVLIAQDVPQLEVMRRRASWKPEYLFADDTLRLESLGLSVPVREIYRDIAF